MSTLVPFPVPTVDTLPLADLLVGADPPVQWLIPGFLPRGTLMALAGEPGAGKSFFTYTLSLAVATGAPFLDFPTTPARVLYFDQENSLADCVQYGRWAWQGLECPSLDLIRANLTFAHFQLGGPDWATKASAAAHTFRPDLIVIDTTTPCCNVQDENDNAEATKVVNALRYVMAQSTPSAACIALKHAKVRPEDGKRTLRGAKAWEGMVDTTLYLSKQPGRPRGDGLTPTKLEPAKVRAFGLREPVTIGPEWTPGRVGIALHRARHLRAPDPQE